MRLPQGLSIRGCHGTAAEKGKNAELQNRGRAFF